MDRVDSNLDPLDAVESNIKHLDAEGALEMFAVRARVVAKEVVMVEHRPCFFVDLARDTEDGGVENFAAVGDDIC